MNGRQEIRDFYGRLLGTLEDTGNRIVARDFYNRIVARGDATVGLIMNAEQDI